MAVGGEEEGGGRLGGAEEVFPHTDTRTDGKGKEQLEWISTGNDAADELANEGRKAGKGKELQVWRGMGVVGLWDTVGQVTANPRHHIWGMFWEEERRRFKRRRRKGPWRGSLGWTGWPWRG